MSAENTDPAPSRVEFAYVGGGFGEPPHRARPAAASGVKSRRSPSGALRADLSGVAVPRRRRFRRATTPVSAINVATVLFDTRQFMACRSAAIRGDPYVPLWLADS